MKFRCKNIIILIFAITTILILKYFAFSNENSYIINHDTNSFNVSQTKINDDYYVTIKIGQREYSFYVYNIINKNKIISDIYYYKDNEYECIFPVMKNNVLKDMMCYHDEIIYNYHDIVNKDKKLDAYVSAIKEYNIAQYLNDISKINTISGVSFYNSNDIDKKLFLTTYSGLISNMEVINLFKRDVYNNKLSIFVDNYYLVANYDDNYTFDYFYLINLKNNEVYKIKSKEEISFDSYIQGEIDSIIYIYDKDNERQYEINLEERKISINSNNIKYYKNGKWTHISKVKASKEVLFDFNLLENYFLDYSKVIKTSNYYYLFKKNDDNYSLYRADINNKDIITYILDIDTDEIYYNDDYIYYSYQNKIYYYSDSTGLKTLSENNELKFNKTIKYYIN